MREGFDNTLHAMRDSLKNPDDKKVVLEDAAKKNFTDIETQEKVHDIQEEKQKLMEKMHEELAAIDKGGDVYRSPKARTVRWNEQENTGIIYGKKGRDSQTLTKGQLLTDGLWDIEYNLGGDVPRDVKKKYVVERTKQQVSDLYNKQIATSEAKSKITYGSGRDMAYEEILSREESGDMPPGILAEKMVKSFLMKKMIDEDVPYAIEDVDVYEDVEHKIDFIIHVSKHARGVSAEVSDEQKDVGIQFTTNVKEKVRNYKSMQIEEARKDIEREKTVDIDDIVLVSLSISNSKRLYNAWTKDKKPGGPDMLWSDAVKDKIYKEVLKNLL